MPQKLDVLNTNGTIGEGSQARLNRCLDAPLTARGPCPLQERIVDFDSSLGHRVGRDM